MRLIIEFEKFGPAKYISHLDVLRAMQRALRRARIPVGYSQGFNPHMLLSFATALSLGQESHAELMDIKLTQMVDVGQLLDDLNCALPPGFHALRAKYIDDRAPALTKMMKWAGYEIYGLSDCDQEVQAFLKSPSCIVSKKSKKGMKDVDIRPMVCRLIWDCKKGVLQAVLTSCDSIALSPELLLGAMDVKGTPHIVRTKLFAQQEEELVDLFDGGTV